MAIPHDLLPPEVLDAVRRGQGIEAIKLLREATGLGLKEAKDAIDAHLRGESVAADPTPATAIAPLPASVLAALQRGDRIHAIRLLREATGLGMKQARERVDAARPPRSTADFGARESRAGGSLLGWLAAAAVLAACGFYAYSRFG